MKLRALSFAVAAALLAGPVLADDAGQAFEQRQANGNVFGEQFAPREAQYISDHFIDIDGQLHRRCISRHRADAGSSVRTE